MGGGVLADALRAQGWTLVPLLASEKPVGRVRWLRAGVPPAGLIPSLTPGFAVFLFLSVSALALISFFNVDSFMWLHGTLLEAGTLGCSRWGLDPTGLWEGAQSPCFGSAESKR